MPVLDALLSPASRLFLGRAEKRFYKRLPDNHVYPKPTEKFVSEEFAADQAHYVLRLREMYVKNARVLWRKFYPVLHSFMRMGKAEEHGIAGPGQLRELGDSKLERIVNLNHRLSGPTPYRGEEVELLLGLYSVPGDDVLKALVKTVGDLADLGAAAGLGGLAAGQVTQVAGLIKSGVESIVGLNTATLQVGVHDAFFKDQKLRTGFYVGMNAPDDKVSVAELWFKEGQLLRGANPQVAKPYADHDYMVVAVERHATRDDWRGLPVPLEYEAKFNQALADPAAAVDAKRKALGALWGQFQQALHAAPYLTAPDRDNIADSVAAELKRRLAKLDGPNPFETRSMAEGMPEEKVPVAGFDLLYVEDRAAAGGVGNLAMTENPFTA